MVCTM